MDNQAAYRKKLLALVEGAMRANGWKIAQMAREAGVPYDALRDFIRGHTEVLGADKVEKLRPFFSESSTVDSERKIPQSIHDAASGPLSDQIVEDDELHTHIDAQLMQDSIAKVHMAIKGMETPPSPEQIAGAAWILYQNSHKFGEKPSMAMADMAIQLIIKGDGNGRELEGKPRE